MRECDSSSKAANLTRRYGSNRARILARAIRKLGYDVAITPINPTTTEMGKQM